MPVVTTNTAANSALNNLNTNSRMQETYLNQLSSGSRINKSSDDAAGLAVSDQLTSDITTLEQSARNAQQAEALLQTADGALARQSDILQRMKSLATQYNSGTVDAESREFINAEYQELLEQLDLITTSTEFNGNNLIDGTYDQEFIVGIQAIDKINVDLSNLDTSATGLNLSSTLSLSNTQVFKTSLSVATGDVTGTTLLADLDANSELQVADTETITFSLDANNDGDFTDPGDIDPTAAIFTSVGATSTVNDLITAINGFTPVGSTTPAFSASLDNGSLVVELVDTAVIDSDADGYADGTLTVGGTAGTNTGAGTPFVANTVYDDLQVIDNAIQEIASARSTIGAFTSAMEFQGDNITTQIENLTAARSTIVDVDIAEAQTNFTNAQVLTEAATAALAQANSLKTSLLALLR